MVRLRELFGIFLRIGAFTLGGGYAMLSMVEMQIVTKKKYIPKDEFWNLIAVIQTLPGVFAINTALYVGYKLRGMKGALVAALGAALPSFVAILLISIFFTNFRENEYVERVFKGIRPCVIALIFVPAIRLIKNLKKSWKILWIPFVAAFLIWWLKVSPILIIVVACVTAVLLEMYSYKKLNRQ
ncbi:MAG: chromate transporter [Bacteroidales bacterium]|nr:chromate transporter [Bacteroidales bacterium]